MSNNINLKELWNKQQAAIPDTKELFEKMNGFKKRNILKLITTNILLVLTSSFIIYVWYNSQPKMISTKIGILLIILAMVLFVFVYNQTVSLLIPVDFDSDSKESLKQLLKFKKKQLFLQSTMLTVYFILLSTGICIYMYEEALRMTLLSASISYGITFLWIVFNWFYLRPKSIKKQQAKINELIRKFEILNNQLIENE